MVAAKLTGVLIRFLRIFLAVYVLNKALSFFGLWLKHAPVSSYLASLRTDMKLMVLILPLGLVFSAFGLLVALVNQTPFKPFSVLFWLIFGFGLIPLTSRMVFVPAFGSVVMKAGLDLGMFVFPLVLSLILGGVFWLGSWWILDRYASV